MGIRKVTINTTETVQNETCPNANNGSITITPSNPSNSYSYTCSNGATGNPITNLAPGNYTITITDIATGAVCMKPFIVRPQFVDQFVVSVLNNVCNGGSAGKAKVVITLPDTRVAGMYQYTYQWNGVGAFTTADSLVNLNGGNYHVIVKNGFTNCTKRIDFTITDPSVFTQVNATDAICYNTNTGGASLFLSQPVTDYSITWANTNNQTIGVNTSTISNLFAGNYNVTIKQNFGGGCQMKLPFIITQPSSFIRKIDATPLTCNQTNDGKASVITLALPSFYSFVWTNLQNGKQTTTSSNTLTNLTSGNYSVNVTERFGNFCNQTDTFTIKEPLFTDINSIVYPNPTTGIAFVEVCSIRVELIEIRVVDALGQVIQNTKSYTATGLNKVAVDFTKIPTGSYAVEVIFKDTKKSFTVIKI